MQGASFTILLLFVGIVTLARSDNIRWPIHCISQSDGDITGNPHQKFGLVPVLDDETVIIRVPNTAEINVVGSYIKFCDEQADLALIELGADGRSYIVTRAPGSVLPSWYLMEVYDRDYEIIRKNQNATTNATNTTTT